MCPGTQNTPCPPTTCGTMLGGIMWVHSKEGMPSAPRRFWSLNIQQLPSEHQAWLQAFAWLPWGSQGKFYRGDKGCDHSLHLPWESHGSPPKPKVSTYKAAPGAIAASGQVLWAPLTLKWWYSTCHHHLVAMKPPPALQQGQSALPKECPHSSTIR